MILCDLMNNLSEESQIKVIESNRKAIKYINNPSKCVRAYGNSFSFNFNFT